MSPINMSHSIENNIQTHLNLLSNEEACNRLHSSANVGGLDPHRTRLHYSHHNSSITDGHMSPLNADLTHFSFIGARQLSGSVSEINNNGQNHYMALDSIESLYAAIRTLESRNNHLIDQVALWKDKYNQLKCQKAKVKDEVVEDIVHKFVTLQESFQKETEKKLLEEISELKKTNCKIVSEKLDIFNELNRLKNRMKDAKNDFRQSKTEFENRARLMKVALSKTMKAKLNDPMVKYLIGTVCNNPLGLARYFDGDYEKVIKFLKGCLRKFEDELSKNSTPKSPSRVL